MFRGNCPEFRGIQAGLHRIAEPGPTGFASFAAKPQIAKQSLDLLQNHLDLLEVISGRLLELQSSVNSGTLHHAARRFHKLHFNAKGFPNYSLRGASSLDDDNHASMLLACAFCAGWRRISASKCQPNQLTATTGRKVKAESFLNLKHLWWHPDVT